jgi:hypothetical protein
LYIQKKKQVMPDREMTLNDPLLQEMAAALSACSHRVIYEFNLDTFLLLLNDQSQANKDLRKQLSHLPCYDAPDQHPKKHRIVQHYQGDEKMQARVNVMLNQWSTTGTAMWYILPFILPRMVMDDDHFSYALKTRLLDTPVGLPDNDTNCEVCGTRTHTFDMHFLNCKKAKDRRVARDPVTEGHNVAYTHLERNAVNARHEIEHVKTQENGVPVLPSCIVQPDLDTGG